MRTGRDLEHPDISHALRTGYPSWIRDRGETEVLNDEDEEEEDTERYWDEFQEDLFQEMKERSLFGI